MALDVLQEFKNLATDDRFIESTREIVKSKVLYDDVNELFTIVPGIKGGQQVAAAKSPEYITRKSQGCGGNFLNPDIPVISQKWNPQLAEIKIKYCFDDFLGFFTQWALGNGYNIKDLSTAEFMVFIQDFVAEAIKSDMLRLVLLSDADIASKDILEDPTKVPFYDVLPKGLIPTLQYFKTVGALESNFVDLSANASPTPYDLSSDYAKDLFRKLTRDIAWETGTILTNSKLYQNYEDYFEDLAGLETSVNRIQNGQTRLSRSGVPIVKSQGYDRWMLNDFKVADRTPHFAIHTAKNNLQIGVDDARSFEDIRLEYIGGDDENFYIKCNYMVDFKIPNPFDFKAAI